MSQEHFEKWGEALKKVQEPFKALAELNVRTLQGLSYLKPDELLQIKKPEELLGSQIKIVVENGHKGLDYLQQTFRIFEKAIHNIAQETKKAAEGRDK